MTSLMTALLRAAQDAGGTASTPHTEYYLGLGYFLMIGALLFYLWTLHRRLSREEDRE